MARCWPARAYWLTPAPLLPGLRALLVLSGGWQYCSVNRARYALHSGSTLWGTPSVRRHFCSWVHCRCAVQGMLGLYDDRAIDRHCTDPGDHAAGCLHEEVQGRAWGGRGGERRSSCPAAPLR